MKTVRIGGGQGFWGDLYNAPVNILRNDDVNYICCDYLAELTLSIMQKQKQRNSEKGYAQDFIKLLKELAPLLYQKKVKIITNAGGMNIPSAIKAAKDVIKSLGLKLKIGYVNGDDILSNIPELRRQGIEMNNIDSGENIDSILPCIVNANVYYGHEPIVECLEAGADIIILGRATDTSLFLSPLIYEFGWKSNEWDSLATGILCGHLLECGGQVTGGNYDYDWRSVPNPENLGYPIAEVSNSGELIVTKTKNLGGLVTTQSVKEQLLYEIHDPHGYVTPDVVADFSNITVDQVGKDRVLVSNVKGKPKPEKLKVCVGYADGYRNIAYLPYSWPDAFDKAQAAAEILKKRLKNNNLVADDIRIDYLGLNSLHSSLAHTLKEEPNEVVLRFAIKTKTKQEAGKLSQEIPPLILNGPPASCFFGGRSKPTEIFALWPALIPRDAVNLNVVVEEV